MIVVQKQGPFANGSVFDLKPVKNMYICHFGFQIPRKRTVDFESGAYQPDFQISFSEKEQSISLSVGPSGVLEMDGLKESRCSITFKRDLPADTLLDFVYASEEDDS